MTNRSTPLRLAAMNLLAYREHSRAELRAKLLERDYELADINAALDKLESEHLVSDARFTNAYVRMRSRRGFGPVRIKQELQERGVARELIQKSLTEDSTDKVLDWFELALETRRKKVGVAIISDFAERAKLMRFLAYRGFKQEQIEYAISTTE